MFPRLAPSPTFPSAPPVPAPVPTPVPAPVPQPTPTPPTPPAVTNIDWVTDFSVADVTFVETQTQYIQYNEATMEGNTVTNTFILPPNRDVLVYIVNTENGPIDPAAGCPPGNAADRILVYSGNDFIELEVDFEQVDETFVMCDTGGNVIAAKEIVFQPVPPPFGEFETVYTDPLDFSTASPGSTIELNYLYQEGSTAVFDGFLANPSLGSDDAVYFISPDPSVAESTDLFRLCPPEESNALDIEIYVDPSDQDDELDVGLEFDPSNGEIQYVVYCSGTTPVGLAKIRFTLA